MRSIRQALPALSAPGEPLAAGRGQEPVQGDPRPLGPPREPRGVTPVFLPGKIPWTEEPGRLQSLRS